MNSLVLDLIRFGVVEVRLELVGVVVFDNGCNLFGDIFFEGADIKALILASKSETLLFLS